VWIRDASEGQNNLRSDINWAIWRRFKAAKIEIPFPQRVVHMAASTPVEDKENS
jgi:small-conductance mechanosensitive channel